MGFFSSQNKSDQQKQNIVVPDVRIDHDKNVQLQEKQVIEKFEERMKVRMISMCYEKCVKSYMEKILNPFEKECMAQCLENMHGLKIEFYNNFGE